MNLNLNPKQIHKARPHLSAKNNNLKDPLNLKPYNPNNLFHLLFNPVNKRKFNQSKVLNLLLNHLLRL